MSKGKLIGLCSTCRRSVYQERDAYYFTWPLKDNYNTLRHYECVSAELRALNIDLDLKESKS